MKIIGSLFALFLIITSPVDGGAGVLAGIAILTYLWTGKK